MTVVAYTALHYGSPYLAAAIRSVIDHVDRYVVLYARAGSHGTRVDTPPPPTETRDALWDIARYMAGEDKLVWVEGDWQHEGQHRDAAFAYVDEGDVLLTLDYDEIWPDVPTVLQAFESHSAARLPMVHFWRSFRQAILHDPAYPVRVQRVGAAGEAVTLTDVGRILHMGYAIPSALLEYKITVHGHKAEWRSDIDWLTERWHNPDAVRDLHPVGSEAWNVETVNPDDLFPAWMKTHPFYYEARIA